MPWGGDGQTRRATRTCLTQRTRKLMATTTWALTLDPYEQIPNRRAWEWIVKKLAGFRCERCGNEPFDMTYLQAHHRDRNEENNCLANGECLCRACHNMEHKGGQASYWRGKTSSPEHREKLAAAGRARHARDPEASKKAALKGWETRRAAS